LIKSRHKKAPETVAFQGFSCWCGKQDLNFVPPSDLRLVGVLFLKFRTYAALLFPDTEYMPTDDSDETFIFTVIQKQKPKKKSYCFGFDSPHLRSKTCGFRSTKAIPARFIPAGDIFDPKIDPFDKGQTHLFSFRFVRFTKQKTAQTL